MVMGTDCIGSNKFNYYMITTTTAPWSINKTDRHDITEILLKVALSVKQTLNTVSVAAKIR
jgi:hypothetical protein